ncbi:MAG: hypothetical protein L0Y71_02090, partial [Gemmataceae bacterium]|nr:hypothetical protein [Gemmataceae bacterium]
MNLHNPNNLSPRPSRGHVVLVGLAGACLLLSVAGCKFGDSKPKDDPLLGVKPPNVAPVPPTTGANPGGQSSRTTTPPIPAATSAASTAALASLPGARQLSIDTSAPAPAPTPTTSSVPNVHAIPRDAPGAPGLLTAGHSTPPITPNLPPAPGGDVFAPLQARGALGHTVDQIPEGIRLTVLVPDRREPGTVRAYEA